MYNMHLVMAYLDITCLRIAVWASEAEGWTTSACPVLVSDNY